MSEPVYPGASWEPGAAAGYNRGRNRMRTVKCHYTVGVNSGSLIRNQGLAQWLVDRDGTIHQYAECDAICWDSGEFNDDGPGIEIEYYEPHDGDAIFTDAARDATAGLVHWLHNEWGVPLDYYDGPRVAEGAFSGFIAHKSLQQRPDLQHYDYWPREDWDRMVSGAPPEPTPPPRKRALMAGFLVLGIDGQSVYVYDPNTHSSCLMHTNEVLEAWQNVAKVNGFDASIHSEDWARALLADAEPMRK